MILVICGAGRNVRLKKYINYSKLLIKINNEYLINHILNFVSNKKIKKIVLVLGYQKEKIKKAINKKFKKKITFITNPKYKSTGNMYSLILSKKIVEENNFDVVWMNADNFISSEILKKFLNFRSSNILCDIGQRDLFNQRDSVKIFINKDKMIDIGKKLTKNKTNGVAIGVYKLKKFEFIKYIFIANIISQYFKKAGFFEPLKYFKKKTLRVKAKNFIWTDIDNIKDLQKAKKLFLENNL